MTKLEQENKIARLDEIRARLEGVEATNTKIREGNKWRETKKILDKKQAERENLTAKIEEIDKRKTDMLQAAKIPIAGLGFDDGGVTYNDVPFKQCSAAERLRVSLAMAMALNPELRVIRITDGSLLDSNNMALVEQMAQDKDYQVWLEVVDDSGKLGVYIEDGEVK